MTRSPRAEVSGIAASLGLNVPYDWGGCDAVWPLLERMKSEGAVVLIKLDGQRRTCTYSAVATGPGLEHAVRADAGELEEALAGLIVEYARLRWCERGQS